MCTASRFNPPRLLPMIFFLSLMTDSDLGNHILKMAEVQSVRSLIGSCRKAKPYLPKWNHLVLLREQEIHFSLLVNHHVLGLIHYCSLAWHNIDKWINSKRIIFKSIISDPFHFVWFVENELHLVLYFINSVY